MHKLKALGAAFVLVAGFGVAAASPASAVGEHCTQYYGDHYDEVLVDAPSSVWTGHQMDAKHCGDGQPIEHYYWRLTNLDTNLWSNSGGTLTKFVTHWSLSDSTTLVDYGSITDLYSPWHVVRVAPNDIPSTSVTTLEARVWTECWWSNGHHDYSDTSVYHIGTLHL